MSAGPAPAAPGTFFRSADGLRRFEQGPTLFSDDGPDYLLYAVAGESGLALAALRWR